MWIMKEIKNKYITLLHKHDELWVEAYQKGQELFCSKCNEMYPNSEIALMANVCPRPNEYAYAVYDKYYRQLGLEINIKPTGDIGRWNKKGHVHGESTILPVLYASKTLCPHCTEEAPDPTQYMRLMRRHKLSEPVPTLTKGFRVVAYEKRKYREYMFQYY